MPRVIQSFFFTLLILFFTTNLKSETFHNLSYQRNWIKIDLEINSKNEYIFFNALGDENHSIPKTLNLRKYKKGRIKVNDANYFDVLFRSRGLLGDHYNNINRSIKIKVKPTKKYKKNDRILNLNSLYSDLLLRDPIVFTIFKKYKILAPETNLAILSINKKFNGIKIIQENLDDLMLKNNGIKLGTMYRESYSGALDSARGWRQKDYRKIWEKQSLKRQKDIDDWITFISSNSIENKNEFKLFLEKNLDIDEYLKFLALNFFLGGHWHTTDHNLVFFNNFEKQKFLPVSYDPSALSSHDISFTNTILFFNNNFNANIFIYDEYWNKYLYYLNFFLTDPNFDKIANESINLHYLKLKNLASYLIKEKKMNIDDILSSSRANNLKILHKNLLTEYEFKNKDNLKYLIKNYGCMDKITLPYDLDCVLKLYKSNIIKYIVEKKKYLSKQMEEIKYHTAIRQVESSKNFFDISLKIKSLSNFKINNLVFEIDNYKTENYEDFYLCLDSSYNKVIEKDCILGKIENKLIIFNLKNKNVIFKPHIFKHHINVTTNTAVTSSVDPHIQLNYKSVEKNFLFYLKTKKVIPDDINLKLSSIPIVNLNTDRELDLVKNIKDKILLDNFDIVVGAYEVKSIPIILSKNKNINNLYKIKIKEKPEWVNIDNENNIKFKIPKDAKGIYNLKLEIVYKGKIIQEYNKKIDVANWTFPSKYLARYNVKLAQYFERGNLREDMYAKFIPYFRNYFFNTKSKLINIFDFNSFFIKKGYTLDQSLFKKIYLPKHQTIVWGPNEIIFIKENTILPFSSSLIIKQGTKILIRKKKGIIFNGLVKATGTVDNPIIFTPEDEKKYFGALIFNHNSVNGSSLKNIYVERGKHMFWEGRFYSGALNVYNSSVYIEDSIFNSNLGDDAINFKYSKSKVNNSKFLNNSFDAIDADFSHITVDNSIFKNNGNDAIDLGTSIGFINNNQIIASGDKGISVGEESFAYVENNIIKKNKLGIANKDESYLQIKNNNFINNDNKIKEYIKKSKFQLPKTVNLNN